MPFVLNLECKHITGIGEWWLLVRNTLQQYWNIVINYSIKIIEKILFHFYSIFPLLIELGDGLDFQ